MFMFGRAMSAAHKLRSPDDSDRFRRALIQVDEAFFASEQRWGVGRLERLVSPATLAAYQRGWSAYRLALEEGDASALEAIGPKMIAALAFMDAESEAAGHKPLDVSTWETALLDGRVLVVVRTQAEASAVIRAEKAPKAASAAPRLGMTVVSDPVAPETPSTESTLPVDIVATIRHQHEGRALTVLTMAEVARLLLLAEGKVSGTEWEGAAAHSGRQSDEMAAHDMARSGYPMSESLTVPQPSAVVLPF
jgi:hypothetical protein